MSKENKTRATGADVLDFLEKVSPENKKQDCLAIHRLLEEVSGYPAVMWGPAMVGYGNYHYTYESGREGDFFRVGFSPRKQNITLYIMPGFHRFDELMEKLGRYKTGKSCLYINRLSDVDVNILKELVAASLAFMKERYPEGV